MDIKKNITMLGIALIVVLAGIGTGWLLAGKTKAGVVGENSKAVPGAKQNANEAGITDEKTFKDTATGVMETGGISGEGTHHLNRDSGAVNYVYLTSTVVDLDSFVGKKVQVWGETVTARKAGWLMDVGKVKVLQ